MKRNFKSIAGVTLLEIMLVLAVAAMVIVMSIKYYQSANSGSQGLNLSEQLQAIASTADSLVQNGSGYSSVNASALTTALGGQALNTVFGSKITVSGGSGSMIINVPNVPNAVCKNVLTKFSGNPNYTMPSSCAAGNATMSITYHP